MTESRVLLVPDMSCGHCELSVQAALDELDGVERASADHTRGEVELTYDAGRVTEKRPSGGYRGGRLHATALGSTTPDT